MNNEMVLTRNGWQLRCEAEQEIAGKIPPEEILHTGRIDYTVGRLENEEVLVGIDAKWLPKCIIYISTPRFDAGVRLFPACLVSGEVTTYKLCASEQEALKTVVSMKVALCKMHADIVSQKLVH